MKWPVAIIGGGIIGLAIAVRLQRRGVQVVLFDAAEPGMGASWGNAGHIATEQVYPVADASVLPKLPAMLLDPLGPLRIDWRYVPQWLPWGFKLLKNMLPAPARRTQQALRSINGQSLGAWQRFAAEWQLQPWLKRQGSLLCCENEQTAASLKQHGQILNALGVENRWLEAAELHEQEPALAPSQKGALFYPATAHVSDLRAISLRLIEVFMGMGGRVEAHYPIRDARLMGTEGVRLVGDGGLEIRAAHVVLSAGAFSRPLVKALTGVTVPLDTERGYHLMLPHEAGRLRVPVSSAERRFVMTPMDKGLRLAGTVEYAGLKRPPNMGRARHLLPLANAMFSQPLDAREASEWMGFRPTTADSLPVIDRVGAVSLAFGHQHLGLTQAAMTAEMIEALFHGEPPPIDPTPFRLARFA